MGDGTVGSTAVGPAGTPERERVLAAQAALERARRQLQEAEREHRLAREALAAVPVPAGPPTPEPTRPPVGPPVGPPLPATAARRPRPAVPAAVVLLVVGAVLLLSAAAVFVALSWRDLGVLGQAGVLAGATVLAAVVTAGLRRARLRAGTEALATVTAGLLVLDLVGARTFDLLGLGSVAGALYVAVAASLVAGTGALVTSVTVRGGRGVVTALVVACTAVPVAAVAAVVQVDRWAGPGWGLGDPAGDVVVGPLEGMLAVGLLLLVLSRPTARLAGGRALQRTVLLTGLLALAAAGTLGLLVASWAPFALTGPAELRASGGALLRAAAVALVGLTLSLLPTRRPARRRRTTSAAVAGAVGVGLVTTLLAGGAQLPLDAALVVAVAAVAGATALPFRAVALRKGLVLLTLLLALAAVVGLVAAVLALMSSVEPAVAGTTSSRPARAAVVAGVLALVPVLSTRRSVGLARRLVDPLRLRLLTVVPGLVTVVLAWSVALLLPPALLLLPARVLAALAVLSLLPAAAVGALLVRARLRSGRWRLGVLPVDAVLAPVAVHLVLGLLLVVAADDALGADGRAAGTHLALAGAVAVLLAALGTRGGPRAAAPPGWWADAARRRAQLGASAAVVTGAALLAPGSGLLAAPADRLLGGVVDGALAAGAVLGLGAVALLGLPGWPAARSGVPALGALAAALAAVGLAGRSGADDPVTVVGGLDAVACGWALLAATLAVQAVAATQPRAGWVPAGRPVARHVLLPGPLVGLGVALVLAWLPRLDPRRLDVTVLPACAVLLVLLGHAVVLLRVPAGSAFAVNGRVRALGRDLLTPLLAGGLVTTAVLAVLPRLAGVPLQSQALPWLTALATVTLTCVVVLRRADPLLGVPLTPVRDVVLPLAAAGTGLLGLVSLRPLTGLPVELESLVVTTVALAVHLLRLAVRRTRAALGTALTVRDLTTATSAVLLGLLGVAAALAGARPLWVPGLTWLVTGAAGLVLAALVGGALGGAWPQPGRDRGWWAVRAGAGAVLVGYALAVVSLDGPLDRLTVPLGAVMVAFGVWAVCDRHTAPALRPGTMRALGPGLLVALLPATVPAVWQPEGARPLLLALLGTALVVLGALLRWRAPLLAGLLVVVPVAVVQALPLVDSVPQWVYLAAAGALALGVGVTFERQRQRALVAGRAWRELR